MQLHSAEDIAEAGVTRQSARLPPSVTVARPRAGTVTTHERFETVTATHDELRTLERLVSQKHNVFARADPTLTNGGV